MTESQITNRLWKIQSKINKEKKYYKETFDLRGRSVDEALGDWARMLDCMHYIIAIIEEDGIEESTPHLSEMEKEIRAFGAKGLIGAIDVLLPIYRTFNEGQIPWGDFSKEIGIAKSLCEDREELCDRLEKNAALWDRSKQRRVVMDRLKSEG